MSSNNEVSINSLIENNKINNSNEDSISFIKKPSFKEKISDTFNKKIRFFKEKRNKWFLVAFIFLIASVFVGTYILYSNNPILFNKNKKNQIKTPIYTETGKKDNKNKGNKPNPKDYFGELLPEAPTKNYPNPTNGVYLTKELYEKITKRKPIAIMLNNHPLSRPQAGISQADIIYEVVAEGGVSRLLGIFHSQLPKRVGSVRSARIYYQQLAAEYWPIFVNWGIAHRPAYEKNLSPQEFKKLLEKGAAETDPRADARGYIDKIGLPTLDQTVVGNGDLFYRDTSLNVPLEHTGFANLEKVYDEFKKWYPEPSWSKYQKFTEWKFKDSETKTKNKNNTITTIQYNFWDIPSFETVWEYNQKQNSYFRKQGGTETIDRNTGKTFPVRTLIILKAKETRLGDKKAHLLYDVIGSGEANIYLDGIKVQGTWKKKGPRDRLIFTDSLGNLISLNRGLIWITILPEYQQIVEK